MKLYSSNENYKLYQGNMLDMLEVIEPEKDMQMTIFDFIGDKENE